MGIAFRIEYPKTAAGKRAWAKEYSLNKCYSGCHWSHRRTDAQFWHAMTLSAVNKAGIPHTPLDEPCVITFRWNDRLDLSNHAYMAKMIEDALKGIVIVDDSPRWVRGVEHYFHDGSFIGVEIRKERERRVSDGAEQ